MIKSISEIQNEIVEEFEYFLNWQDKYSFIIEQGSKLPKLSGNFKIKENLIIGCQSNVWLTSSFDSQNGRILFEADSDALIVKGLISLLIRIFSGQRPRDILETELFLFDKIGLKCHLSPSRVNGLASMLRDIKSYAIKYVD